MKRLIKNLIHKGKRRMSRQYQVGNLVPECRALFIDKYVPHTGTICRIYKNVITFKDVTFLDRVLDYEYRDTVPERCIDRRFDVQYDPTQVYRTARIFLPKYPSVIDQLHVFAVMESLRKDPKTGLVDIHDFIDQYPQRSLYVDNIFDNEETCNVVHFDTEKTVIIFDDNITDAQKTGKKIYRPMFIGEWHPLGSHGFVLLEYSAKSPLFPEKVIIPSWLSNSRNYRAKDHHDIDEIIKTLRCNYSLTSDKVDIVKDDRFNEDHIIRVLHYSPAIAYQQSTAHNNALNNIGLINTWKIDGNDLLINNLIYYDEVYRRRKS